MVSVTGFHSCTEDEFLEPTTVDLKIKMVNTKPFKDLPEQANKQIIEFGGGNLQLSGIEFDGKRENNDNHYFFREFENTLVANLSNDSLNQTVSFDIPKGSYNVIQIKLHTNGIDSIPGLTFRGKWKKQRGRPGGNNQGQEEIPVELNFFKDYEESIELTLNTEAGVGKEQIVFDGDNWNTLEIRVNLASIFRNLNPGKFNGAQMIQQGNKQKIIISAHHNTDMYYSLVNRVERSIKAVIK